MKLTCLVAGLLMCVSAPASALCIYAGKDNVKTTIEQEFSDSQWVVRAHVEAADYHWSDAGESWTVYHLRVVTTFKGLLSKRLSLFTFRDSGGFYLDAAGAGAGPDFDHDYLLFLSPMTYRKSDPAASRSAVWINYNCGQSKEWSELGRGDQERLQRLGKSKR